MKSLLLTNDFPPVVSGISTQLYELWRRLPPDRVAVLAPRVAGDAEFDARQAFAVFREAIPTGGRALDKLAKLVRVAWITVHLQRRHRFAKLHCGQVLSTGVAGLLCKKLFGVPFAVYVDGSETVRLGRSAPLRKLMQAVCREASEVIANSAFTAAEYVRFGVAPEKIVRIPPGVDTRRFRPRPAPKALARRFKPAGERILLTVGRLDERKNHETVLRALPEIARAVPDVRYLIVGTGCEEASLRRLAAALGVGDRVTFVGHVPDDELPRYYNLCDVFVLPNRVAASARGAGDYEGFGIVFLEAAACGKPVVGGRSGGVADAVDDGRTGLLVEPEEPGELADAVVRLLADTDLAARMGEHGRRRAVKDFDWRRIVKQLEPLLG